MGIVEQPGKRSQQIEERSGKPVLRLGFEIVVVNFRPFLHREHILYETDDQNSRTPFRVELRIRDEFDRMDQAKVGLVQKLGMSGPSHDCSEASRAFSKHEPNTQLPKKQQELFVYEKAILFLLLASSS